MQNETFLIFIGEDIVKSRTWNLIVKFSPGGNLYLVRSFGNTLLSTDRNDMINYHGTSLSQN